MKIPKEDLELTREEFIRKYRYNNFFVTIALYSVIGMLSFALRDKSRTERIGTAYDILKKVEDKNKEE